MQNTTIMPLVEAPADVVYIAAQIYLYHTPLFDKAVTLIRCLHPNATILICADMWKSADDWRATYEQKLADVSHMYIVPDGRLVGKGVWAEYEILKHATAIYAVLG